MTTINHTTKGPYIDLSKNLVFKYFFSSNEDVLISLLKSFLPIKEEVKDVHIINKEQMQAARSSILTGIYPPATFEDEYITMGVRVTLADGTIVHVELAMDETPPIPNEQIYKHLLIQRDADKWEPYYGADAIYSLTFKSYDISDKDTEDFIHTYSFYSDDTNQRLDGMFGIKFEGFIAELTQVPATSLGLQSLDKKWCYLLRNSANLADSERAHLEQESGLKLALELIDQIKENQKLSRVMAAKRRESETADMELRSLLEDSKEQSKEQTQQKIASRMLAVGYAPAEISKITRLSEAEISRLENRS